jgi:hypothetical protein
METIKEKEISSDTFSVEKSSETLKEILPDCLLEKKYQIRPIEALTKFIFDHPDNWQSILSSDPYNIKIQQHPKNKNMFLFSYDMIKTKWLDENYVRRFELLACRGLILAIEYYSGSPKITVLCHAFDKFFNKGEFPAAPIDWETAIPREKIDGSLIKLWHNPFFENKEEGWTFSTNNSFNADGDLMSVVPVCKEEGWPTEPTKFLQLIDFALKENPIKFLDLPKYYTFYFELVSPYNRIVIPYQKTELYLLGARNNITDQEFTPEEINKTFFYGKFKVPKIILDQEFIIEELKKTPKPYTSVFVGFTPTEVDESIFKNFKANLRTDIQKLADVLDANHEGFVVCDKHFNRVKVKGKEYLYRHHLRGEQNFSFKYLFECLKLGSIDDIKGHFTELVPICEQLENEWKNYYKKIRDEGFKILDIWDEIRDNTEDFKTAKKLFAERVKQDFSYISSFAFDIVRLCYWSDPETAKNSRYTYNDIATKDLYKDYFGVENYMEFSRRCLLDTAITVYFKALDFGTFCEQTGFKC